MVVVTVRYDNDVRSELTKRAGRGIKTLPRCFFAVMISVNAVAEIRVGHNAGAFGSDEKAALTGVSDIYIGCFHYFGILSLTLLVNRLYYTFWREQSQPIKAFRYHKI